MAPSTLLQVRGPPLDELVLELDVLVVPDVLLALVDDDVLLALDEVLVLDDVELEEEEEEEGAPPAPPAPPEEDELPPSPHGSAQRASRHCWSAWSSGLAVHVSDSTGWPRQARQSGSLAQSRAGPQQDPSRQALQSGLAAPTPQLLGPASGSWVSVPLEPGWCPVVLDPPALSWMAVLFAHAEPRATGSESKSAMVLRMRGA